MAVQRPQQIFTPVVAVMGHVDHGKTSLLDAIRKTKVAEKEAGGITQHIGAYRVPVKNNVITFLDTPGHAAFSKMRSRGASATDIVVLVVSAVEGVKPQTIESIQHIKKAGVQFLVALTKMDLPEANPEMAKAQLTEHEVFVEGYGGETVVVPVSAKTGNGLDKLLEMIVFLAELVELKHDPKAHFEGLIIESEKDIHRGSVATVLVRKGTLRHGEVIFAGETKAKIRAMVDDTGKTIKEAGPSVPVLIMGWEEVPEVGSVVSHRPQDLHPASEPKTQEPEKPASEPAPEGQAETAQEEEEKEPLVRLKLILRADVTGSLEAVRQAIETDEVEILSSDVGEVTDADVLLAEASGAKILAFHTRVPNSVKKMAEQMKVKIKSYQIIYELIEDLQKQVLRLIEPTINEKELALAEVAAVFTIKGDTIAGCKVKSGELTRLQKYHVRRGGKIIADPRIKSLKRGKEDIESAKAGTECGIAFRSYSDFQVGDEIIAYEVIED